MDVDIAVFARAPVAGQAKTRLIPMLGAKGAAELQHALMRRSLTTALAANLGPVSLWCTPDCEHPAFVACSKQLCVPLFPQHDADLGARMFHAFAQLCPQRPTLIIGTDCPALTVDMLRAAANVLLEGRDAVFVPAEDGGYVLIGLRHAVSSLFSGMPWGSETVMADTRERLRRAGLRYRELAPSWDLDRAEDFDRLRASGLMTQMGLDPSSVDASGIDSACIP
ncbi:MAG: TIGR04282 family arsenosugar biosynthesis glycosyltransferase [Casimicrobiaceae bacterium]